MMLILLFILAALLSALGGGLVGLLVGRRTARIEQAPVEPSALDRAIDAEIERAATAWAASKGRSETAAGLVANRLRLAHRVNQRRARRQGQRRWFA